MGPNISLSGFRVLFVCAFLICSSLGANDASNNVAVNNQNSHLAQSQCAVEASKPGLVGGASRIPESEYDEINEMVADALTNLKAEAGSSYEKTVKIYCASRQVVAGSLYKIVAQFQGADNEKVDCVMEIWSRPWIKQDGTEVKLKCDEKPVMKTRYRRSASDCFLPLLRRAARNAAVPLINRNEFQHIEELINDSVPHAEIEKSLGKPLYKKISTIYCATELYVNDNKHYQINGEFELQNDIFEDCVLTLVDSISGPDVVTLKCDSSPEYRYEYYPSILLIPHNKKTKEQKLFVKFLKKHNRSYGHTSEELNRYEIFVNNLHKIKLLNEMEEGTAKYGLTEFADLTSEEYSKRMGLLYNSEEYESNNIKNPLAKIPDIKLPKEFDWRDKGAVTKVKNQGNCGSCWAFSVTGNIEGLHALKSGKLEEYSEQELLDCDTVDKACSGGLPDNAYKAIEKIGGLELEDEYPYEAHKNKCSFNKTLSHVQVKGAVDLPKNETAMALWLIANGPISIGINANGMQFYRGGISHPWRPLCRHSSLDHGVLIVGFGIAEYPVFNKTLPYWIVKNSWGTGWGERGYYRVFRGDNTCGVSEMASSAVLSD